MTRIGNGGRYGNLALFSISLLVAFASAEGLLRLAGGRPGFIPSVRGFKRVDTLEVVPKYVTGMDGVFRADPKYRWPPGYEINSDGFRSPEFSIKRSRTSVLMLGDSFVWGDTARPITDSFADVVRRSGYDVFNTGIPGVGPSQYRRIAETYIPKLRPDLVAVFVFLGNDFIPDPAALPGKPLYHVTNAGMLLAVAEDGSFLDVEAAYRRALDALNVARVTDSSDESRFKGRLRHFFYASTTGTYLWVGAARLRSVLSDALWREQATQRVAQREALTDSVVRKDLEAIRATALEHGSAFLLFVIPVPKSFEERGNRFETHRATFDGLEPHLPGFLSDADYVGRADWHFNNKGHERFGRWVVEVLQTASRGTPHS